MEHELAKRIRELEEELEKKNLQIQKLEGELGKKALYPALTIMLSKLQPVHQNPRLVSVDSLKFFTRLLGNAISIEFPASLKRTETIRHLEDKPKRDFKSSSRNSEIGKLFERLNPLLEQKNIMKTEVCAKVDKLKEEFEKKTQIIKYTYKAVEDRLDERLNEIITKIGDIGQIILIEKETDRGYLLKRIQNDGSCIYFELEQLTDRYGIALKNPRNKTVYLNELTCCVALSQEDSETYLKSLEENIITVLYQIIDFDGEESCCPIEITPRGISLQDYNISFHQALQKIQSIQHKDDGKVKFNAVLISEDCGFVYESVIEIFTSELSSHILNILHIHIEDTSDEIPIDVVYILPDQNSSEYSDFETDLKGVPLRYKILVKNGVIHSVLYNNGSGHKELAFIERRIKENDYFSLPDDSIAQVIKIPTGLLGRS